MVRSITRTLVVLVVATVGLLACAEEQSVEVFIPPEGDAELGKQVFIRYDCQSCHTIPGVELPGAAPVDEAVLPLGVRLHRVRDYGDLLTAVIYPDHTVSGKYLAAAESAETNGGPVEMPDFTQTMTVAELVDLIEFLHAQYSELLPRQYQGKGAPPLSRIERRFEEG